MKALLPFALGAVIVLTIPHANVRADADTGAGTSASAATAFDEFANFDAAKFRKLPRADQIELLGGLKNLIGELERSNPQWFAAAAAAAAAAGAAGAEWREAAAQLFGILGGILGGSLASPLDAEAADDDDDSSPFNCFNAGWPNQRIPDNPELGRCPAPGRGAGKAFFTNLVGQSKCAAGQTPCNPILFGENVCFDPGELIEVSPGVRKKGANYAWIGCSKKSTATVSDLVDLIVNNPKYASALAVMAKASAAACTKPPPASVGMCRALKAKARNVARAVQDRTDNVYDCYDKLTALWENEVLVATQPSDKAWRKVDSRNAVPANRCADYQDAGGAKHSWCRGLPDNMMAVAVDVSYPEKMHGVLVTHTAQDDGGDIGATYLPAPANWVQSDNAHANQLRGLMSLSHDAFNKILASAPGAKKLPFTQVQAINSRQIAGMVEGLPKTCSSASPSSKDCATALETCTKVKDDDAIRSAVANSACRDSRFAALPTCHRVGNGAGGSGGPAGAGGQ